MEFYGLLGLMVCYLMFVNPGEGQITGLAVDCQTDAATQDVTVTITGTVGAGAGKDPTYVSVVGCNQQFAVTNTGGVLTAKLIKLNCPNMAWNQAIKITIQENNNIVSAFDGIEGYLCTLDSATQTVTQSVSASSVATRATNTGKYKPSITMVVSTTNDCATPAGRVTVGTALWVCITLGADYAVADGVDLVLDKLTATDSTAATAINLVEAKCAAGAYLSFQKDVTHVDTPGSNLRRVIAETKAFMWTNQVATETLVIYKGKVEFCVYDAAKLGCDAASLTVCTGTGLPYGRKKRSVANETVIIDEVEISTAIEVTTDELAGEGDQQAISTDDVCLPNGGFYGLIAFFVIALLASVSASCFLFTRSRKSRKYMDDHHLYYKGTDGASNPSFR